MYALVAEVDHLVPLLLLPQVLRQRESGREVVGLEGERVGVCGVDAVLRHLLQTHVHSLEVRQVGVVRRCAHHAVEDVEHDGRVATLLLLVLTNGLLQHRQLRLYVGLLA